MLKHLNQHWKTHVFHDAASDAAAAAAAAAKTGAVAPPDPNASPFASLPEADRKFVTETLKVADLPGLVGAVKERETRLGDSIVLPKPDAKLEERKTLYERLRPKTAEDYQFELPKDTPTNFVYDADMAKAARTTFHGLGLDPIQARGVHDWYVGATAAALKKQQDADAAAETAQHNALVKIWGAAESDAYKQNVVLAGRAAEKLGIMDALKSRGILAADGGVRDAAIVKALAEIGAAFFKEDSPPNLGGGLQTGPNPWKKETWNETEQGKIFKADPTRAQRLAVEAGLDPSTYKLT